ncbi:hypothetical protein [Pseudobacillus wudalianchiensis]|nr:hypothetical protein [Bacillus wudalianchiensis]
MKNMNKAATIRVTKIGRNEVNDPKDGNESHVYLDSPRFFLS